MDDTTSLANAGDLTPKHTRSLIESSPEPLVTFNASGKITYANEALAKITGVDREKLIGMDINGYFTDPNKAKASNREVFEKGYVSNYPLSIKRQDGKATDVLYNASVYKDDNGNVLGAFASAHDITDQKIAEERILELNKALEHHIINLKESEDEIGAIFNYAPEGVIVIDERSIITQWNPKATEMLGWKKDEVIGKPLYEVIIPERLRRAHRNGVQHFLKTGQGPVLNRMVELPALRKDNTEMDVGVTISPFNYKGKQHFVGFISDISEQKQASEYTRSLIEASLDPFVTINTQGKISDANEASAKITGIPRERLIGTVFSNFFTEPVKAQQAYQLAFEKGFVSDYPLTIRNANGTTTDVLYNASVYKDSKGNVLGVFAAARDITAQKHANQYARSLIEASLDPLLTINAEGKITDVNKASVRLTGVPREKLIGTNFSDYFSEPVKAQAGYRMAFEKGVVEDYPLTIRHASGKMTEVLFNASLYRDAQGNIQGVLAAARDLTRILTLQKEIKESEEFLSSVVDNIPNMIFVKDAKELRFVRFNKAGEELLGYSKNDLLGKNDYDFFPKNQADFFTAKDKDVLNKGELLDIPEEPIQTKNKGERILHTKKIPITDKDGNPLYLLGISEDITEQKQASQFARGLIEANIDPLFMISTDGKITDVNEASVKLTGVPREKLIGSDFTNMFTDATQALESYQLVYKNGTVTDYPLIVKHSRGELVDVLYNATLYKDTHGNVLGTFAVVRRSEEGKHAPVKSKVDTRNEANLVQELEKLTKFMSDLTEEMAGLKKQIEELKGNKK